MLSSLARVGTLAAVVLLQLLPSPRTASACSLLLNQPPREHPFGAGFPTNGIFMWRRGEEPVWQIDGRAVGLTLDAELSELLGQTVMRPTAGDFPAGVELIRPCQRIDGVCGRALVAMGPDLLSPSRPVLDVQITLVDGGSSGSGFSCQEPDVALLTIRSETGMPLDDVAADAALTTLAYVGATAAEAEAAVMPAAAFASDETMELATRVYVGFAGERDLLDAFRQPSFCVAVEVMDAAGNLSERSEPVCVDSLDRDAPTTTVVQGTGCSVVAVGGERGATGWLFGVGVAVFWVRRRRR